MQYFDFSSLINQYSKTLRAIIPTGGNYDEMGDYVALTPKEKSIVGAVISHKQSKIFRSEGTLTQQDRALYMLEPLEFGLQGAFVIDEKKIYRVNDELENAVFTGVFAYTLKYLSAFDLGEDEVITVDYLNKLLAMRLDGEINNETGAVE